jgi:AraC-like DNA-binding protein
LYVLRVRDGTAPAERVRAWTPAVDGIREVLHARFVDYAYPMHVHDVWTVLIVDDGAIHFDLDRRHHDGRTSTVTVLPPHVAHDGRAAGPGGFRKRVLYLDESLIPERAIGHAVDGPGIADPALRVAIDDLHARLQEPPDALDLETRLALVSERLRAHLAVPDTATPAATTAADDLRAMLDADLFHTVRLADAAATLGTNVTHLVRAFGRRFGVPPHRYVVGRRVGEARRLLLAGVPPADVAATVGFHDQAHLTRHFVRFTGTTPARFAAGRRA